MKNLSQISSLSFLLAATFATTGCGFNLGEDTDGDLSRLEFSYTEECLLGCSLRQPMMTGSTEEVRVTGHRVRQGEVSVESSDPSILTFTVERHCPEQKCEALVDVTAHASGAAQLVVRDLDGDLVDRITLEVHDPASFDVEARIVPEDDFVAAPEFSVPLGETLFMQAAVFDADGERLRVSSGLLWTIETPEVARFNEWEADPAGKDFVNPDDDDMSLEGIIEGVATVAVSAGSIDERFTVEVTN